jgi:formiminotetrahydrofolate cyclodeaminase
MINRPVFKMISESKLTPCGKVVVSIVAVLGIGLISLVSSTVPVLILYFLNKLN